MDESRLGSGLQQANSLDQPIRCRIPEHGMEFPIVKVGHEYVAEVLFEPDYAYFEGHFDRFKLVPGACQLEILKSQVDSICVDPIINTGFQKVKFKAPVRPGDLVRYTICFEECAAIWKATSAGKIVSEGRFLFQYLQGA